MGYSIARSALRKGCRVILISGPASLRPPSGAKVISVTTASEMRSQTLKQAKKADIIVSAAAVSDYSPGTISKSKIKSGRKSMSVAFKKNPDILKELGRKKGKKLLVGFALESEDLAANASRKMKAKNLDMIVANPPSSIEGDTSRAVIISGVSGMTRLPGMDKGLLAARIMSEIETIQKERLKQ